MKESAGTSSRSIMTSFCLLPNSGSELESDEFMNAKKSHEVQSMSEVVACLAQHCGVKQVEERLR